MTYLEVVNEVQRRLREDVTAAVNTSTYSTMLGDFVNQAKREVEDAWNWGFLRQDITVTTANGTTSYALTGAGKRSRLIADVMDDTSDTILLPATDVFYEKARHMQTNTNDQPYYYRFRGVDSSGDIQVDFFDTPDGVYSIIFPLVVPQADLVAGTDESTEIKVPGHPVVLRAWSLAVSERGEDGGMPTNEIDKMFAMSLSDSIGQDGVRFNEELVWTVE